MAEAPCLLERAGHHSPGRLAEVLRPGERRVDEALVRGLFGHSERRTNLGPRAAVRARGLHITIEQRITEATQLVHGRGGGLEPRKRVGEGGLLDRRSELLECQTSGDGVKVLLTLGRVKAALTQASLRGCRDGSA